MAGPREGPRNESAESTYQRRSATLVLAVKSGIRSIPMCQLCLCSKLRFIKPSPKSTAHNSKRFPNTDHQPGLPKPGEKSVQETFTDEWGNRVQGDELSFLYSLEDLKALNKKRWAKMAWASAK